MEFDISYDDPVLELYVLSDRTNKAVDAVDTRTNQVVAQLGQGSFVGYTGKVAPVRRAWRSARIIKSCSAAMRRVRPVVVIDERNGAVLATLPNASGSDEVWFNPGDDHYFLARSAAVAATQLLGVIDANSLTADPNVFTALAGTPNAHSVAADPIFNQVYVPIPAAHSTVCSSAGGSDAQGCIAVFTAPKDHHAKLAADQ